jgi:hypothetical protein
MCDEWMSAVQLPITLEQFHQLPRHPAYKYEYLDRQAYLTPRPKFYHALLDLAEPRPSEPTPDTITVRLIEDGDLPELERVFAAAFNNQQPFAGLEDARRHEAARDAIAKVGAGRDGPWIREASFVALEEHRQPVGAIFVTLLPDEDPAEWDSFHWREPPPSDWRERRLGRPHITWIFVSPWQVGQGVGSVLLTAAIPPLQALGYRYLASTFLLGNESSMLWHWRSGFRLQTYPGSRRRWPRIWAKQGDTP